MLPENGRNPAYALEPHVATGLSLAGDPRHVAELTWMNVPQEA